MMCKDWISILDHVHPHLRYFLLSNRLEPFQFHCGKFLFEKLLKKFLLFVIHFIHQYQFHLKPFTVLPWHFYGFYVFFGKSFITGIIFTVHIPSCIYLLLDEEKLLASPNDGAEEARLVPVEELSSDQTPVEPDPYAKFIPEYINEPFVVALFATFSAIILQGKSTINQPKLLQYQKIISYS